MLFQIALTALAIIATASASHIGLAGPGWAGPGLGWGGHGLGLGGHGLGWGGHGLGWGGPGIAAVAVPAVAVNHAALSPHGPSGVVTGAGAAGPSGVVTGAGAIGPSGVVNGHGAVGPTGPNGHGVAIAAPALLAAPAWGHAGAGYGLGHGGWGHHW